MTGAVDVTFVFADLSGYTALTEAHGNDGAAAVIHRYVEIAREGLPADARIVERVGDELVIAAASAATALNIAARVTARAVAGQILCTEAVVQAAPGGAGVTYRLLGRVRLRNIVKPMALYEIGGGPVESPVFVDPVCRMQVTADSAARVLTVGDVRRYFCSLTCAAAFTSGACLRGAGTRFPLN